MSWVFLVVAMICEIVATSFLKAADGFTRAGSSVVIIVGYSISFYFFSLAVRGIPLGIAYAVWAGVGIMAIAFIAWLYYGETLDHAAILGMALIVAGVIVLNVFSKSVAH